MEEQIEKRKKYRESVFYIAHLKKEKKKKFTTLFKCKRCQRNLDTKTCL